MPWTLLALCGVISLAVTTSETRLWDVAAKKELYRLERGTSRSPHMTFSPDGKVVATPGITLWDAGTGQKLRTLDQTRGERPFAWAADGKTLAVSDGSYGQDIHLFDAATGQRRQRFKASVTNSLAFGPEDRILAAGNGKEIILWDLATQEEVARLKGHESAITSLIFSPDRKTLYSAGLDRTVLVWDLANLRLVPPPQTPTPIVALPAEQALDRLRDAPAMTLLEALEHPEPEVRAAAVQRLGPLAKDKAVFTALVGALADKDDDVCYQAVAAVGSAGPAAKVAIPKLVEILKHPRHRNRTAAVSALGWIGPEARAALPALLAGFEASWHVISCGRSASLIREGKPFRCRC